VYYIAIAGANGQSGWAQLNFAFFDPPPNDNFVNALAVDNTLSNLTYTTISSNQVTLRRNYTTVTGYTMGATKESGDPNYSWGGTIWLNWTAPASGRLTVTTIARDTTGAPMYHFVWLGTGTAVNALSGIASTYNSTSPYDTSFQYLTVTGGTTYRFELCGMGSSTAEGAFQLTFDFYAQPNNDLFANRTALNTSYQTVVYNLAGGLTYAQDFIQGGIGASTYASSAEPGEGGREGIPPSGIPSLRMLRGCSVGRPKPARLREPPSIISTTGIRDQPSMPSVRWAMVTIARILMISVGPSI
jgi:hypothetical protein